MKAHGIDVEKEAKKLEEAMVKARHYLDWMVPQKVVALRTGKGLSQREMATIMGLYKQNWHKVEKGKRDGGSNITVKQAVALSIYFDLPIDYILKDETNQKLSRVEELLRQQLESEKKIVAMLEARVKELERKK